MIAQLVKFRCQRYLYEDASNTGDHSVEMESVLLLLVTKKERIPRISGKLRSQLQR
jgi:hypothetical protein